MKKLLMGAFLLTVAFAGFGQNSQDRSRMEKERQEIQKELQEIQSTYNKVRGQSKATMGQLNVLQRKMEVQGRYISNINNEIHILNDDIYLSTLEINRLQRQLDTLKAEYAKSVEYAYKNNSSYDYLNFIFSSVSFNDALKRISYLKSYRNYRKEQVNTILETQRMIQERKQQLLGKQTQKQGALHNQQQQLAELESQKKEKDVVMTKLKSQEKDLSKQISMKKKRDKQLKLQIMAVIRREMEEARKRDEAERARAARANAAANASSSNTSVSVPSAMTSKKAGYVPLNSTDVKLNADFEKNRGILPWPVDNGYVSIPYGTGEYGGVKVTNPGITIATPSVGTSVKAVFGGEVSSVQSTGDGMMIMVRHGKYFTVYSNLSSTKVSRGDQVSKGQVIGQAGQAEDGTGGQLDFLLMNETRNVNPEPWLHHR